MGSGFAVSILEDTERASAFVENRFLISRIETEACLLDWVGEPCGEDGDDLMAIFVSVEDSCGELVSDNFLNFSGTSGCSSDDELDAARIFAWNSALKSK